MDPFRMIDAGDDNELVLDLGGLPTDEAVQDADHEPNGYFWEGVAQYLLSTNEAELVDEVDYDCEAGAFVALGAETALTTLKNLMLPVVVDPDAVVELIEAAEADGFEFDD